LPNYAVVSKCTRNLLALALLDVPNLVSSGKQRPQLQRFGELVLRERPRRLVSLAGQDAADQKREA